MASVSIKEARQRLGALVAAAQRGEAVTITRRGQSVAKLTPIEPEPVRRLPSLREFRASIKRPRKGPAATVNEARGTGRY